MPPYLGAASTVGEFIEQRDTPAGVVGIVLEFVGRLWVIDGHLTPLLVLVNAGWIEWFRFSASI